MSCRDRAAVLVCLLVCVVSFVAKPKHSIRGWRKLPSIAKAEISVPCLFKGIPILNSSIQINRSCSSGYVSDFTGRELAVEPQQFSEITTTTKRQGKLLRYWRNDERNVFLSYQNDRNVHRAYDVIRGRLSAIFDQHPYARNIRIGWIGRGDRAAFRYACIFPEDISTQLAAAIEYHHQDSPYQSDELEKADNNGNGGDFVAKSPRLVWIAYSFLVVGLGFVLCIVGGQHSNNERRLLGAALFVTGLTLGALGFLIWWPTYSSLWRWTWGRIL